LKKIAFVCIVAILMSFPAAAQSQQGQGQIKGRVADNAGRPVSNLTVVVRNVSTGVERETKTDQSGAFIIAQLDAGQYAVKSQTAQTSGPLQTHVEPASTTNLTIQQNASGEVAIMAETIATDSTASVRSVWGPTQIELLPQPNAISRTGDYYGAYNLALLNEAVTPGYIFQTGVGPAVEGRPNTSNNYHVNGIDNNNQAIPGPLVSVSNEVTNEFNLTHSQESTESGHSSGGNLNITLADPGNQWHGGVYDYLNNRNLNASEPALAGSRDRRYDQNRMGGKVGGPIMKNTLFGFANFEYIPLRTERSSFTRVLAPTAAGFSALAFTPGVSFTNLNVLRNNLQVTDTAVAFGAVNGTTVPLGVVNTSFSAKQDKYQGIARLDWHMSKVSTLSARYVHNDTGVDAFGPALEAFKVPGHTQALLGALSYTTAISSSMVASVNGGYNRLNQSSGAGDFNFAGQSVFPSINIQDTGLSLGPNGAAGQSRANTYQFATGWDWAGNGHHIRFGMDFRDVISSFHSASLAAGNYTFSSLERFLLDLPPDVVAGRSFGPDAFHGNRNLLYAYIQDTLRFRGMDVDLGLGYQYAAIPQSLRRQTQFSNLSVPGLIEFTDPEVGKMNFAPHVGIAWSPTSSQTVIRGSFGMAYDALYTSSYALAPDMAIGTVAPITLNSPGFLASGGVSAPSTVAAGIGRFTSKQELPYVVNWTASASHAFFTRLATEVKYMGNHGVHQPMTSVLNDSTRVTATSNLPVFFSSPSQATLNSLTTTQATLARRIDAFTAAGFTSPILTVRPDATSWYNAASLKVSEIFTAGTQVSAQYTYSDNRTEATGTTVDLALGRSM